MKTKIFNVFRRPPIKVSEIKRITHDYNFPIVVTVIFLLIVAGAGFYRASQKSSLAELLTEVSSRGQEYGTLLSNDKADELKKNNDTTQLTTGTPAGSPTSFAINASSGGSATTSAASAGGGTSTATTPTAGFSAAIASFKQDSVALECSTPKPKAQTCSKRYVFSATVRTKNGPGSVNYGWRSNLASAISEGSVSVGGGDAQASLQKTIVLECATATNASLQFVLLSPSVTQSALLTINHNCNEI